GLSKYRAAPGPETLRPGRHAPLPGTPPMMRSTARRVKTTDAAQFLYPGNRPRTARPLAAPAAMRWHGYCLISHRHLRLRHREDTLSYAGQELQLRHGMALAPRLQQSVKFLQMSTLEFQQAVRRALETNPFLEETEPEPDPV